MGHYLSLGRGGGESHGFHENRRGISSNWQALRVERGARRIIFKLVGIPLINYVLSDALERSRYIMLSLRNAIQAGYRWHIWYWAGPMETLIEFPDLFKNKTIKSSLRMWLERMAFLFFICTKTTCLIRIHCKLIFPTCKNSLTKSVIVRRNTYYIKTSFYNGWIMTGP